MRRPSASGKPARTGAWHVLRITAIALTLPILGACVVSQGSGSLTLLAAPDGVEFSAVAGGETDELFDAARGQVDLVAAANETVAFRLWISHSSILPAAVSLSVEDLRSESGAVLSANSVQFFRVQPVSVSRWPGWHLRMVEPDRRREWVEDVLVPAHAPSGGLPIRMGSGEPLAVWADVSVPKAATPGVYLGKLHLHSGPSIASSVTLRLEVLPVVLPDVVDVVLAAELDHESLFAHHVTYEGRPYKAGRVIGDSPVRGELQAVLDAGMRMLQAHKVSPLLPRLYPVIKIGADGRVDVRWADYDAMVEGYLDGGRFFDRAPLPLWSVPFDEHFPPPPSREALRSPAYSGYVRQYIAECARHFAERGWLDRAYARIPHAPTPSAAALASSEHFARIIRSAMPELRILSELFPQDLSSYGWTDFPAGDLIGYVDVWCPPAQFLPAPQVRGGLTPSQTFWAQADRPPFSASLELCAGPTDARVLPWQARQEGAGALLLGPVNAWPAPSEGLRRLDAQDCVDHAAAAAEPGAGPRPPLIYPGSIAGLDEPIPSVRLKRLRRGMYDLAWLRLLKDRGAGHIAEVLAESLAPFAGARAYGHHYADGRPGGWVRDPAVWREAQRIMVEEVRASADAAPGRIERVASGVRWRRFMEGSRHPRIEVETARVRIVGKGEGTDCTVECALRLYNAAREPVAGSAQFGSLPVGWSVGEAQPEFGPIAPGGSSRVMLTAQAPAVPWGEEGIEYIPVELTFGGEGPDDTQRLLIRLAHVAAQSLEGGSRSPAPRRLRIDGDLGDWPSTTGNLASDFVLITGENPASPRGPGTRAKARTRVSVAADAEALYFAFDCAFGKGGSAAPAGHTNAVVYEDMVPISAELVEVVLDPTAAGTHSPADLYHVVVTPGGAVWERGIGFVPPVGRREPWAADLQHAAKIGLSGWTAEVCIPLAAFGAGAARQRLWAVNFARFDARGQEYSNWSGATGDFYDPAAAGNLALPPIPSTEGG